MLHIKKSHICLAACLVLSTGAAHATQSVHKTMADCAGIFLAVSEVTETPDRKAFIREVSRVWSDAAAETAGRDMSDPIEATAAKWRDKGPALSFTQAYHDSVSLCRSLAQEQSITFPKPPQVSG